MRFKFSMEYIFNSTEKALIKFTKSDLNPI